MALSQKIHQLQQAEFNFSETTTDFTRCPICKVKVKTQNLKRHLRKVHVIHSNNIKSYNKSLNLTRKNSLQDRYIDGMIDVVNFDRKIKYKIDRCYHCGAVAIPGESICFRCQS